MVGCMRRSERKDEYCSAGRALMSAMHARSSSSVSSLKSAGLVSFISAWAAEMRMQSEVRDSSGFLEMSKRFSYATKRDVATFCMWCAARASHIALGRPRRCPTSCCMSSSSAAYIKPDACSQVSSQSWTSSGSVGDFPGSTTRQQRLPMRCPIILRCHER